jgi:type I restriction enzyme M protein
MADQLVTARIIFRPKQGEGESLFTEELVEFEWVPGLAISQSQKSVMNLHEAAISKHGIQKILEISTRSQNELGISLSAFNLQVSIEGRNYPVEAVYQSSKVFQSGGPFLDLMSANAHDSKKDLRLKNSGELIGFRFENQDWPLTTSPNFYDYLYIRALMENVNRKKLLQFDAFSDIAFNQNTLNPKVGKSFNCQARSAAIFVSLLGKMDEDIILSWLMSRSQVMRVQPDQLNLF